MQPWEIAFGPTAAPPPPGAPASLANLTSFGVAPPALGPPLPGTPGAIAIPSETGSIVTIMGGSANAAPAAPVASASGGWLAAATGTQAVNAFKPSRLSTVGVSAATLGLAPAPSRAAAIAKAATAGGVATAARVFADAPPPEATGNELRASLSGAGGFPTGYVAAGAIGLVAVGVLWWKFG